MTPLATLVRRLALAASALLLWTADGLAQAIRHVAVRVTTVSGTSVYVDRGRAALIQPGDILQLHPAFGPAVTTAIAVVSSNSARADLPAGTVGVVPGVLGEVLVPEARFAPPAEKPETQEPPASNVPAHPPWQHEIGDGAQERPLLAPAFSAPKSGRATELRGRVYLDSMTTLGDGDIDNRYQLTRVGTELNVFNPFRAGGSLRFRGDVTRRESHFAEGPDDETTRSRLDRFSYRIGEAWSSPLHFEAGRFLQPLFPEFGVLDGVTADVPTGEFSRTGVSVGAMPEPLPGGDNWDSTQVALFHRYASDLNEDLVVGLGYQKTWHRGDPDRDLFLVACDMRPFERMYLNSTVWLDYYGSGDEIKPHGVEVTEAQVNANYYFVGEHGIGLFYSHVRWPELKRNEILSLDRERTRNDRVDRAGSHFWYRHSDTLRFDGRVDVWRDQDREGGNGDIGVKARDLLYSDGWVGVSVFHNTGSQVAGSGLRLSANRYFGGMFVDLHYEFARYDNSLIGGGGTHAQQQTFWANVSSGIGDSSDVSLSVEYRHGDSQDSTSLGLFFQTRF